DVDGDEVDRRIDLAVAQPEFPYVGVGHRLGDLRLHPPDRVDELARRHVTAQQYLVADHERAHGLRVALRHVDRHRDVALHGCTLTAEPDPLDDLDAVAFGDLRHAIEAIAGGIGTDAIGDATEAGHVVVDLRRIDPGGRIERALRAAKRRVGDAVELLA